MGAMTAICQSLEKPTLLRLPPRQAPASTHSHKCSIYIFHNQKTVINQQNHFFQPPQPPLLYFFHYQLLLPPAYSPPKKIKILLVSPHHLITFSFMSQKSGASPKQLAALSEQARRADLTRRRNCDSVALLHEKRGLGRERTRITGCLKLRTVKESGFPNVFSRL